MANRHKSYNEIQVPKFENLDYAQAYFLNIVEVEDLSVDEALRETIKAMSLSIFSKKSGQSIQSVSDFVSKRQNWSSDKLIRIIKLVFDLKVKLAVEITDGNEVA